MLNMDLVARLAAYAAGLEEDSAEDFVRESLARTERDGEEETVAWLEAYIRHIDQDRAALFGQHIDALHEAQRQAAITVQTAVRGWLARRELEAKRREEAAATKIQALVRGHLARQEAQELRKQHDAATKIQALFRGQQARKQVQKLREQHDAATKLQALVRGYQQRKEYLELRTATVQLQAQFRMWQARRELEELKAEKQRREEAATLFQSAIRGWAQRNKYQATLKFYEDQEDDTRLVNNPALRLNSTVTLAGHRVLAVYMAVVMDKLKMFYQDAHKPVVPRNKNLVQVDTHPTKDGWLTAWAKLAWKELYASQDTRDKPAKVSGERFPCIGLVKINGAKQHFIEEKLWVKVGRTDRATRYNDLGDSLALTKSAKERARGIRKVLTGDLTGVADIEMEAALAMLGAETARNPRSYGVGLMLLDLVENEVKYGNGKSYNWKLILGSNIHGGESEDQYEERKTGYRWDHGSKRWVVVDADKANRWSQFNTTLRNQAPPKFHNSPVKALWAGKWPMSPSASMSLGGYDVAVPTSDSDLNAVQYKELKTILKWYRFVMRGIDVAATNTSDAEDQLTKLFRLRLLSTRVMDNTYLKQNWV
ncbi:hypothetical protein JQX13_28900 [Archangium violaceum]|uniref:hypothetical protein n=1 Tax=Archangium violaceum TaxID=83451 RepID=UPI00193BD723|nr:hypothetical protein [Archangium violaceum]QRK04282.1 hypothetical protein JQX13_28900 [Archangium violaceum]